MKCTLLFFTLFNLQKEVDEVTKNNPAKNFNDLRCMMSYTEAVLQEVQRLGNIVPGSLLHTNSREAKIGDYVLPPGTSISSNMEAILMDPNVFSDPYTFNPDRFMDENECFIPHPNVVPFGVGKRRCLGEVLAKTELFIFFAGLIQKFEIKLANEEDVPSTKYRPGITLSPYPFKIRFIARN